MTWSFGDLKPGHYGAILADPPWRFKTWDERKVVQTTSKRWGLAVSHYSTMSFDEMTALPVAAIAATDCSLFMWMSWPLLPEALTLIEAWGFAYKTCAFLWTKADASQVDFFADGLKPAMKLGYWTRSNSEACLLATRGKPKRLSAAVRQGIIEPGREHSRKPDCVHKRIEHLVAGPYCELFARAPRAGWDVWGNETDKFKQAAE
jgi:N6-adenosine-specific RNA methylase IME4